MENQELDPAILARKSAHKKEKKAAKKELAKERVFMAAERLQLAWVRSAITLTALGFTIYKIFESLMKEEGKHLIFGQIGGREIGMFMLFAGFFGLIFATFQHKKRLTKLKDFYKVIPFPASLVVTYLILLLSLFLLITTFFKLAS